MITPLKLISKKRIFFSLLTVLCFSFTFAQTKTPSKTNSVPNETKKTAPTVLITAGINGNIGADKMKPEDVLAADSIMAVYVVDGKFKYPKIVKYNVSFGIKGQLYDFQNENARFNEKIKEVLSKIDKTCKAFFSDIKVMMPDGTILPAPDFKVTLTKE